MPTIDFVGWDRRAVINIVLVALCILLLASNVVLLKRARIIDQNNEALKHFALEVKRGTHVPPIEGLDPDGRWASVGFQEGRPLVVLVFSPRCAFSDKNWANWSVLAPVIDRRARAVYVDVSKTADRSYLSTHPTGRAPVVVKPDAKAISSYNLSMTPQTILVDGDGTVQKVWSGVLGDEDLADIQARLEKVHK
jgi:hypothetical protein